MLKVTEREPVVIFHPSLPWYINILRDEFNITMLRYQHFISVFSLLFCWIQVTHSFVVVVPPRAALMAPYREVTTSSISMAQAQVSCPNLIVLFFAKYADRISLEIFVFVVEPSDGSQSCTLKM
jgi:hypothetical protein